MARGPSRPDGNARRSGPWHLGQTLLAPIIRKVYDPTGSTARNLESLVMLDRRALSHSETDPPRVGGRGGQVREDGPRKATFIAARSMPVPSPRLRHAEKTTSAAKGSRRSRHLTSDISAILALLGFLHRLFIIIGVGPSQSKHWNVRGPLSSGGGARIRYALQLGQIGRFAWPLCTDP